jgi:hypothetical protein
VKLTESERAENRKALSNMSLSGKLGYVFEYYKFPLALALIAAVALGSFLYYRLTRKDALLYVACANIAVGDDLDRALNEGFARAIGANPGKKEVSLYRGLYLSRDATQQNHEYAYASGLKLLATINAKDLDLVLMNRESYDLCSGSGYLMDLSELISPEDPRFAPYVVENLVILEDNAIEVNLGSTEEYTAVTQTVANALDLSGHPLFTAAGFSGDVYLGIIGNTTRLSECADYLAFLTE